MATWAYSMYRHNQPDNKDVERLIKAALKSASKKAQEQNRWSMLKRRLVQCVLFYLYNVDLVCQSQFTISAYHRMKADQMPIHNL